MDDDVSTTSTSEDEAMDGDISLTAHNSLKRLVKNNSTYLSGECRPPNTAQSELPRRKIPFIIWWVMKITCVFHERILVVNRSCYHCQVRNVFRKSRGLGSSVEAFEGAMLKHAFDYSGQNYYREDGTSESPERLMGGPSVNGTPANAKSCILCDSYWWDHYGAVEKYTDRDLGVRFWNHRGSWFLSILVLFGAIAVIVYDACYYLGALWGQQSQLIHVISYGTFMVNLILFPVLNMAGKMRIVTQGKVPQLSWSTALDGRFMVKRLQYLSIPQRGVPGKLFLLLGISNAVFHTWFRGKFYLILCDRFSWHSGVSVMCGGFILLMFVCFQYLMYLNKLSFQRHFRLVETFIRRHQGDLDKCRHILGSAFQDYNCYRKLIAVYMTLFIPTLTWALTTHVTWQYFLRSNEGNYTINAENSTDVPLYNTNYMELESRINILIWQEIILFFSLSVWAVGGLDASYMWKRLRLRVLMIKRENNSEFWHKMTRFLDTIYERYDRINVTMVFSIIGFFMALEFGNHQTTRLVIQEPYCNVSTTNF